MKKEYKLVGKVTIPKKKRKEVKSIIQKILYLGGIREKETIEIDGVEYNFFIIEMVVRTGDEVRIERYGFRKEGEDWIFTQLEIAE